MIDLTPLDIRNKRGDFKKLLRGYDPQEVDVFLELAAERLEELVRENMLLRERSETLERQVGEQSGREQAVQEALVTAQELRSDIHAQAQREADHVLHEAQTEARRLVAEAEADVRNLLRDAERRLEQGTDALEEIERRRIRFLKAFRQLLERELDGVEVEEQRAPLEDRTVELDLGGGGLSTTPSDRSDADADEADDDISPDASVGELAAAYVRDTDRGPVAGEQVMQEARADASPDDASPADEDEAPRFAFDSDDSTAGDRA